MVEYVYTGLITLPIGFYATDGLKMKYHGQYIMTNTCINHNLDYVSIGMNLHVFIAQGLMSTGVPVDQLCRFMGCMGWKKQHFI